METTEMIYLVTDETDRTLTVVSKSDNYDSVSSARALAASEENGWTIIRDAYDRFRHTMSLIGYSTDEGKVYQNYLMHALMTTATTEQMTRANQIARDLTALATVA